VTDPPGEFRNIGSSPAGAASVAGPPLTVSHSNSANSNDSIAVESPAVASVRAWKPSAKWTMCSQRLIRNARRQKRGHLAIGSLMNANLVSYRLVPRWADSLFCVPPAAAALPRSPVRCWPFAHAPDPPHLKVRLPGPLDGNQSRAHEGPHVAVGAFAANRLRHPHDRVEIGHEHFKPRLFVSWEAG
jgi:hypothetical protein